MLAMPTIYCYLWTGESYTVKKQPNQGKVQKCDFLHKKEKKIANTANWTTISSLVTIENYQRSHCYTQKKITLKSYKPTIALIISMFSIIEK